MLKELFLPLDCVGDNNYLQLCLVCVLLQAEVFVGVTELIKVFVLTLLRVF